MTVEQGGTKYEVRFRKEHVGRGPYPDQWGRVSANGGNMGEWLAHLRHAGCTLSLRTRCQILRDGQVVAESAVVLNPHDRPSRLKARKWALAKALKAFPKAERGAFWREFLRENGVAA